MLSPEQIDDLWDLIEEYAISNASDGGHDVFDSRHTKLARKNLDNFLHLLGEKND